jgi:hypothetical protein
MKKVWIMLVVAISIHLAAFLLMLRDIEPFSTCFYSFAWWTYIVLLSGINHLLKRNSLLLDNPVEFLWVFLYSTPVWLFFEIYNFSLNNWHYIGVPAEIHLRWPGYVIAFGTVLPGVFETETLLMNLGLFAKLTGRPVRVSSGLLVRSVIVGLLMMLLVFIHPQLFFPLLWLGGIFLLDPLIYWLDQPQKSLAGRAENGEYGLLVRFAVAGMICGLLWEFWNYWAAAKWVYTIPYFSFLQIFEMPLLGFFGFPPFALQCYLLYRAFLLFRRRFLRGGRFIPLVTAIFVIIYCVIAFRGIDRWTVESYKTIIF